MMRLAAAALVAVLVAIPLTVLPSPPVVWLAVAALIVGGAGAVGPSVPLATAGGSLALIAYALGLVIAQPPVDPVVAIALGATLVLLLVVVHFSGRVEGAVVGRPVILSLIRHWLAIVTAGVVASAVLTAAAVALAGTLRGAALPVVVAAAALGVLLAVAGATALVTTREDPPAPDGR